MTKLTYTTLPDTLTRHIIANIRSIQGIYGISPEELLSIMEDVLDGLEISWENK